MKNKLRNYYKDKRSKLTKEEIDLKSSLILKNLLTNDFWKKADTIMVYLSFKNEVETKSIIKSAWEDNKKVIIPICQKDCTILPSLFTSFNDLEANKLGILEPSTNKIQIADPLSIDLCLIPGLAFDLEGHRLGFGKGYYDRFLPLLKPNTPKIALSYELQLSTSTIINEEHDVLMDGICTEEKLYILK